MMNYLKTINVIQTIDTNKLVKKGSFDTKNEEIEKKKNC